MELVYIVSLLPFLGLIAYPNWKRVLQLSFAFSLLSLELLTLSKAFENPVLGLGFGIFSFGIPYSLITNQTKKDKEFSSGGSIVLIIWVAVVIYLVVKKGIENFSILLKIVSISLLNGIGIISLGQKLGKTYVALTLLALWALIWIIKDYAIILLGGIAVVLYVAQLYKEGLT
ncbi:MAG: hypothetical protein PWQ79_158 [Thermococcaceae archaeon]|uniref:hypothetical protein n=1 Tax=Thermococcus sp. 101 C5 TaxID=2654197 RepID=UPI00128BAA1E|nr:hypothetical protein [Thermococcus sp. 101 C5]MDK2913243.1 hypothetical protein [Thermococcaceae archaeon]MPW40056.1 hypothetical protein [Thermococcus sp. 101 C5]